MAKKPYFTANSMIIFNEDFLSTRSIKQNSIDLTVTSPPYSADIKYGAYKDDIPHSQYLKFTKTWLKKCLSRPSYETNKTSQEEQLEVLG